MLEIYLELVKDDYVIIFEEYLKIIKEKEYKKEVLKKCKEQYSKKKYKNISIEIKDISKWEKGLLEIKDFSFLKNKGEVNILLNEGLDIEICKLENFDNIIEELYRIRDLIINNSKLKNDMYKISYLIKYISMFIQYNKIPLIKLKEGIELTNEEEKLLEKDKTLECILTKKAVCQGYSLIFYYICTLLKINSAVVSRKYERFKISFFKFS